MRERHLGIFKKAENLITRVENMTERFDFLQTNADTIQRALSIFDQLDRTAIESLDDLVDYVNGQIDLNFAYYENHENATHENYGNENESSQEVSLFSSLFRAFEDAYNFMRNIFNHTVHPAPMAIAPPVNTEIDAASPRDTLEEVDNNYRDGQNLTFTQGKKYPEVLIDRMIFYDLEDHSS